MARAFANCLRHLRGGILLLAAGLLFGSPGDAFARPQDLTTPAPRAAAAPTGRTLRIASVEFEGQWKTRKAVLRALARLEPGDPVDADALAAARGRLLDSGFFDSVDLATAPGDVRGTVRVTIRVAERHRPYVDTGVGWRDPEGWYLTLLGLREENPLGLGGRATLGLQLGFRTYGVEADARVPLGAASRFSLHLRLRGQQERLLWYENEPGWIGLYDEQRLALDRAEASAGLGWAPRPDFGMELGFAGRSAEPAAEGVNKDQHDTTVPSYRLPPAFQADAGSRALNGLYLGLSAGRGGMDGAPGRSVVLRANVVKEGLGADADYLRVTGAARATAALPGAQRLALGLRAGWVGEDAPYYERFRLGGSYSVRGFRDHSLSPPEGDDGFLTAALEYRVPLLGRARGAGHERLIGLVFADAGRGWANDRVATVEPDVDYQRWQLGAGYGLRLRLPWVGLVGLDVGLPVTAGITGEPVWLYLTLGHSF